MTVRGAVQSYLSRLFGSLRLRWYIRPQKRQGEHEYNGWANRETWATVLWLSNDEEICNMARLVVRCDCLLCICGESPRYISQGDGRVFLSHGEDALQSWVEDDLLALDGSLELNPDIREGMRSDIGSLWRVDWRAVANAFRKEE
jgi:hypothetical protein